ncbi:MAG: hypothetical protein EXS03_09500 [Phycisphaerales bacterium]|nr:hypothetical protein [Phycisphaerales bacterium]
MTPPADNRWSRLRESVGRAFHVDPPGPATPTPEEAELVDRIAREIVTRRMAQPALLFLESSRPLAGVGAAVMHFLQPFCSVVIKPTIWSTLATFLERGGSVEYLCLRIEALERERA